MTCPYIYIYTHIWICIYIYIYISLSLSLSLALSLYLYIYIYVCRHVYTSCTQKNMYRKCLFILFSCCSLFIFVVLLCFSLSLSLQMYTIHRLHEDPVLLQDSAVAKAMHRYFTGLAVNLLTWGIPGPATSLNKGFRTTDPGGSMYLYGKYLGLKGAPISLLWGLYVYYNDTWTLWGCLLDLIPIVHHLDIC